MIEEQEFEPGQIALDVCMLRWAKAGHSQRIGTTGLDGCIGIAILNDTQGNAWVLHSPAISNDPEGLNAMLDDARSLSLGTDNIRIILTGGRIEDDTAAQVIPDRKLAKSSVQAKFPSASLNICWGAIEDFMLQYINGKWEDHFGSNHF